MRQWINLAGMLTESQEPAFEHDCSRCEFVGTDVPQKGEPQTNQVDMYIHHNPSHTILIRRYGSEPANYASHSYYPNMPLPEKYQRVLDAASTQDADKTIMKEGLKKPRWELPPEPGTAPIPDDHVRLYHQTKISNLPSIRKHGIQLKYARGIEGPKAIYADTQGFYEKPDYAPTVEFSVPKERWDKPFVIGDVEPSSIIGIHKPWHKTARYIEDNPEVFNSVLSGEHDDLLGDHHYGPAIRFIKHKHARR